MLKDLPETPSQGSLSLSMKFLVYSAPVLVGLLVYWVIKHNYHNQFYSMILNRIKYLQ